MISRGLIIKKHYLDMILNHNKIWEMRSTKTNIRGKIGLIESGSGLILGEAEIIKSYEPLTESELIETFNRHQVSDLELLKKWNCPWVLHNVKKYKAPIPYKHPKGAVIWVKLGEDHKI